MQTKHAKRNRTRRLMQAGILLCLLMMAGCASEEIINKTVVDNSPIQTAKSWYDSLNPEKEVYLKDSKMETRSNENNETFFKSPTFKYYLITKTKNKTYYEVDLTDVIQLDFATDENIHAFNDTKNWKYRRSYSRLVIITDKKEKKTTGCIMTIIPSKSYTHKKGDERIEFITYLNRDDDFDGMILFHNLDGSFSNGWGYGNGQINKKFILNNTNDLSTNSIPLNVLPVSYIVKRKEKINTRLVDNSKEKPIDGDLGIEVVCIGKQPGYRMDYYTYLQLLELIPGYEFPRGSSGEGNMRESEPRGGYIPSTPPAAPAPEVKKDPSFVGTKAECVYDKLNNLSGGFKAAIQKFDGKFPVSHLKFTTSSTLSSDINAVTIPPRNYITEIQINSNNLNRPNLSIARTIIHETIHAEIFRKLLSLANTNGEIDVNKVKQYLNENNYPGLFDYYTRYGINGFQEEQMAQHYRTTITDILKQLDPNQSTELYNALAWEGLIGTQAWVNTVSKADKYKICKIINDFNDKGEEPCP